MKKELPPPYLHPIAKREWLNVIGFYLEFAGKYGEIRLNLLEEWANAIGEDTRIFRYLEKRGKNLPYHVYEDLLMKQSKAMNRMIELAPLIYLTEESQQAAINAYNEKQ